MKTYKLYVCMPSSKFGVDVVADELVIVNNRLHFYSKNCNKLLASYSSQYTIIESIKENK